MEKVLAVVFVVMLGIFSASAQVETHKLDVPFGWAKCASSVSFDDYDLCGGNNGDVIILTSNGKDMYKTVSDAIMYHDVVIFDGSNGDFVFSQRVSLNNLSNKTIVGFNNARLRTQFTVTDDIRHLLDSLEVKKLSSNPNDNKGGTLVNGSFVQEECEYNIRKNLIEYFNDEKEEYRKSGIFYITNCNNLIIRNLELLGPGALDVGGYDLITLSKCRHIWVDHVHFTDGMDGNLDIVSGSSLITVSWCKFDYTERTYNHPLSCLISGETGIDEDNLNITWAFCHWADGCGDRLPWVHFGTDHILNCFYECPKANCIRGSNGARFLVEGNYFISTVKKPYNDTGVSELTWKNNILEGHQAPPDKSSVEMGYVYTAIPPGHVPTLLKDKDNGAGATISQPFKRSLQAVPSVIHAEEIFTGIPCLRKLNISCFQNNTVDGKCSLKATEGITLSTDGINFSNELEINGDRHSLTGEIIVRLDTGRQQFLTGEIEVSYLSQKISVPISANVTAIDREGKTATVEWPFESSVSPSFAIFDKELFETAAFDYGSNLNVKGTSRPNDGTTMVTFNPIESLAKTRDNNTFLKFSVTPTCNKVFLPERIEFNMCRIGTDMSAFDLCALIGDKEYILLYNTTPERSSSHPGFTSYSIDLSQVPYSKNTEYCIYIYYLNNNKEIGVNDVRLTGKVYDNIAANPAIINDNTDYLVEYYDILGRKVVNPLPGRLYLKKTLNGTARKFIYE